MTATDELRRLLDGRGIEYEPIDSVHSPNRRTLWGKAERSKGVFGMCFKYETIEFKKGMRLTISDCSPTQAVEATLGSDLKAENAELRELVRDMRGYVESVCFECRSWEHFGHRGKPSECGNDECECKLIADRMRELGVDA